MGRLKGVLAHQSLEDTRFATRDERFRNDKDLRVVLRKVFKDRSAEEWFQALDAAGVPVEISDPAFGQNLHDLEWVRERGWTVSHHQPLVGQFEQVGLMVDLSDTPGVIQSAPIVLGDGTEALMLELGYAKDEIARMHEAKIVGVWSQGEPLLEGPRRFIGIKPDSSEVSAAAPSPSEHVPAK